MSSRPSSRSTSRSTSRTSSRSTSTTARQGGTSRKTTFDGKPSSSSNIHAALGSTNADASKRVTVPCSDPPQAVRDCVKRNGGNGLRGVAKLYKKWTIGKPKMFLADMRQGLHDHGCMLSDKDIKKVLQMWGTDGLYINFEDFLVGMRGELNTARREPVARVFRNLDLDGNGVITTEEFKTRYRVHPDNKELKNKSESQIIKEFMRQFEGKHGNDDGNITKEEFEEYYKTVSASFDSDRQFLFMMNRAWMTVRDTKKAERVSVTRGAYTSKTSKTSKTSASNSRRSSSSTKRPSTRESTRSTRR